VITTSLVAAARTTSGDLPRRDLVAPHH